MVGNNKAVVPIHLDKHQMAELLNISTSTLGNWMRDNVIPYYKVGKTVRFNKEEVMAALEQYKIPASPEAQE